LTAEIKRTVRLVRSYAHVIVENPFSAHLQVGSCVNAQALGNPSPEPRNVPTPPRAAGSAVRILHPPSAPAIKGTDAIRAAIAAVRARGREIEYVELTGRPNAEVLAELARCDFVIDQAYSDTPMALFATEAAVFGKAAIVGGYITPEQMAANVHPDWMPPVLYCHPKDLADAIDRLCTDVEYRRELGARAQAFVQRERNRRAVAKRFLLLARDEIPADWWFDTRNIEYVHGLGEEQHIRRLIRGVIDHGGTSALELDDNPDVLARVLSFVGLDDTTVVEVGA
jgi:hypothetical protein